MSSRLFYSPCKRRRVKGVFVVVSILVGIVVLMIGCRGKLADPGNKFNTDHYGDVSYMYSDNIVKYLVTKNDDFKVIKLPDFSYDLSETQIGNSNELIDTVWYVPLATTSESSFSSIHKIRIHNESIFIMDIQANSLLMFDISGGFLRTIGSTGRGPGEYSGISYFEIMEDHVVIIDEGGSKVLYYSLDGEFIREQSLPLRMMSFLPIKDDLIVADIDGDANFHLSRVVESKVVFFDKTWSIVGHAFPYDPLAEAGTSFFWRSAFKSTPGGLLYNPFFDNYIYCFGEDMFFRKYYVDVGKGKLPEGIRKNLSWEQFGTEYSLTATYLTDYYVTDKHIAITYFSKKQKKVAYYSKKSGKVMLSSPLIPSERLAYLNRPIGIHGEAFIMKLTAGEIISLVELIDDRSDLPDLSSEIMTLFRGIDPLDNPVLVFYKLRCF